MTNITIKQENDRFIICVDGHAERTEYEEVNKMCAAVSILTQTLRQALQENIPSSEYHENVSAGYTLISVPTMALLDANTSGAIRTALTGYKLLVSTNPDKISIYAM